MARKLTVKERLEDLHGLPEVDEMLLEGMSCPDVTKFIQTGLEELEDVKPKTLTDVLVKRRAAILGGTAVTEGGEAPGEQKLAAIVPEVGRNVGPVSRNLYMAIKGGMDRMVEFEALYLASRDRLDTLLTQEREVGYPFEMTDRTFLTAMKLLEAHGKQEEIIMGRMGGGETTHKALDLKQYSEETAKVLQRPDSRRRVVSLVERLNRMGKGRDIPLPPKEGDDDEQAAG